MRRTLVGVAVTCLSTAPLLAAHTSVSAAGCQPGNVCVYPSSNFGRTRTDFTPQMFGKCQTNFFYSADNLTENKTAYVNSDKNCATLVRTVAPQGSMASGASDSILIK